MKRNQHIMGGMLLAVFLAILLSACGSGGGGSAPAVNAEASFAVIPLELEWARSTEDSDSVPFGDDPGSKAAEGLALPLDPTQVVFDNGEHTPELNKNATPVGNEWASWPQYVGPCGETYEVRHLQATFNFPENLGPVLDLILFSPYYTAPGDIIPINDNVYVYLNNTFIGEKGFNYGAIQAPGGDVPFDFANETDGWYADGSFGSDGAQAVQPGLNILDFVAEEACDWGGIGRLELKLVVEFIGVPVDIKPRSCPNPVNVKSKGVLPAAILGTGTFDVTQVDLATVLLEGVAPLRWAFEDVATPQDPFIGKQDAFNCTTEGPDGFLDLTLKFRTQEVVAALGEVQDRDAVVLTLTANLKEGFDSVPIQGEDVIVILKKP